MISSINGIGFGGTATPVRKTEMDRDAFLTLLVAQLKHQDPTSPLQPHEFAAQLAQFSSVEQLTELNARFEAQAQATQLSTLVGQTSLSAALIGRVVVAEGNQVSIPSGGAGEIRVDIGGTGGVARLRLLDAKGQAVAERDLGQLPPGSQTLMLPADLPPGDYHYALEVTGPNSSVVPVTTYTTGTVSGVSFQNGQIMLRLGGIEVTLESLAAIEPA